MMKKRKLRSKNFIVFFAAFLICLWTLIPIFWAISASFKDPMEIYTSASLLPKSPSFSAYITVMGMRGFWQWVFNSFYVTIVSTIFSIVLSILAAYGFSRFSFKFKGLLLILFLVPRIIPRVSIVLPLFEIIWRLGLLDSHWALIITYTASAIPFSVWLLLGFFNAVPKAIEEAAEIDGASLLQRLIHVIIPLSWPGIVTAIVLCVREAWNEFPFVLSFMVSESKRTIPYALYSLRDAMGIEDWARYNAFTILSILPLILIFIIFQRKIVGSLVAGATK